MNSKRLWATTAILFALSASGPNFSGVWAQSEQAVCSPGWDWVRFIYTPSFRNPQKETVRGLVGAHMQFVFVCRTRIHLGKIRVSLAPCWTPSVAVLVSLHRVIAVTDPFDSVCSAIYTIPPLNSTQNYVPPQRDSTSDLTCDCDSIMYRFVSV